MDDRTGGWKNRVKSFLAKYLTKFDVAIIIAVIVLAGLFVGWQAIRTAAAEEEKEKVEDGVEVKKVRFVLETNDLPAEPETFISIGDELMETIRNTVAGEVVSISSHGTKQWASDWETGGQKVTETDRITGLIELETLCEITDSGVLTEEGGYRLYVGQSMSLYGPGYFITGTIVVVERD